MPRVYMHDRRATNRSIGGGAGATVGALADQGTIAGTIERLRAVLGDDTFVQRFAVAGEVGRGGMGAVHRAIDRQTQRAVAIKVLHEPAHQARFTLEAELLERLAHPAIVAYVGHGVTSAGDAYLAMAWLDGESLAQRLERGPLPIDDVLVLGTRIAEALAHAHREGVVHRDLKPSNVMLVDGEPARATLIDFGIAKDTAAAHGLTETGQLVGTPGYMAPEQAMGAPVLDARTDLFAFGALLHHALTGTPPFEGRQPVEVLAHLLMHEPPPVHALRPEVPARLSSLVAALLVKEPEARPADAAAVAAELGAIARAREVGDDAALARPSPLAPAPLAPSATAITAVERPARAARPRRRWIGLVAAGGIAAAATASYVALRPSGEPDGAPETRAHACKGEPAGACEAACAAGDGLACQSAGRDAYDAARGDAAKQARAIDELLGRGCALGDPGSCYLAGIWIKRRVSRGDRRYTRATWVDALDRGCTLGAGNACATLADSLLAESPADTARALALYERGCEISNIAACRHAAEMLAERAGPNDAARAAELRAIACRRGDKQSCR